MLGTLTVMLTAAGWISLRPVARRRRAVYPQALGAICLSGVSTLALVTQGVLAADPWHDPTVLIPLGGMVFAASMNAVSLSAERLDAELARGSSYRDARPIAMRSALIPQVNTLFAVGLVSLPGMMTGQILSGCLASDRRALPDHGDVHAVRRGGHVGGVLPGACSGRGGATRHRRLPDTVS